ncbi:SgcJ/EcaC family oxidoreductase [Streptomyces sp. NPDC002888]|uniref:SgcJ/EcaC family oxidoreductase n=1 Tax=Streptomyces sp. NPDC002888 TaxID=3364668 RepID=UPI003679EFB8
MDTDTDLEAIAQVVATIEHSQRNELPGEFVSLFCEDAIWTTGHGKRLDGRDEISAFTHQMLPGGMKDTTVTYEVLTYEVLHVVFIRPDMAAVRAAASCSASTPRTASSTGWTTTTPSS